MGTIRCPICGAPTDAGSLCPDCGWDLSADPELCPTVFSAAGLPSRMARSERLRAAAAEAERNTLVLLLGNALFSVFPTEALRECAGAKDIPGAVMRLLNGGFTTPAPPPMRRDPSENILGSFSSLSGQFGLGKVKVIRFRDTLRDMPEDSADISEDKTGSVMAWFSQENDGLTLTVCGEGGVSAPENGSGLFRDFTALRSIDFGGCFHTENCRDMQFMFAGCKALTSLDLSSFNTAMVTDMSFMFNGCSALKALDLSSFDTAGVTDMRFMFNGCRALTSLDLSSFDTSRVTDMSFMFAHCRSLRTLNVTSFDTSRVVNMDSMFWDCCSLETLDLSSFDTAGVTNMSFMFSGCSGLIRKEIMLPIPEGCKTENMFYGLRR